MASSYGFQPTAAPQGAPAAPVEGQPAAPPAGGQEAAPPGGALGGLPMMLMFALPLLLIFMMTRGQNKRQKQMESGLKNGDRVVTQAGLIGKIVDVSAASTRVKLEIAPGVNVTVLKSSIQGVDGGEASTEAKDKAPEKK